MKLKQILLELREVLDRYNLYGYWIDSSNKLHPVGYFGHRKWIEDNIPKENNRHIDYTDLFLDGYVRVIHEHPEELAVEGTREGLKRALPLIVPSLVQDDLEEIYICFSFKKIFIAATAKGSTGVFKRMKLEEIAQLVAPNVLDKKSKKKLPPHPDQYKEKDAGAKEKVSVQTVVVKDTNTGKVYGRRSIHQK